MLREYGRVTGSVNQCVKVGQTAIWVRSKLHKFTAVETPGGRVCCDSTVV
jgi:hypothetical protein